MSEKKSFNDNYNSILSSIIDDNDINKESIDEDYDNDKEDKKEENSSVKSLIELTKKMSKSKDIIKYNKIRQFFQENINSKFSNYKNSIRKRSSIQNFPKLYLAKRSSAYKTDKNVLAYLGRDIPKFNPDIIKQIKEKNMKKIKKQKNNKFITPFNFQDGIKKKKEKLKNIYNLWNNCKINIKYDNNIDKNELIINKNKIYILYKQDKDRLMRKHCAKKCRDEFNYEEVLQSMGKNKKIVKSEMVNQIMKLTSKNTFKIKLASANNLISNFYSNITKNGNKARILTKSFSFNGNIKPTLNKKSVSNFKRNNYKNKLNPSSKILKS